MDCTYTCMYPPRTPHRYIPKSSKKHRMIENCSIVDIALDADDLEALSGLTTFVVSCVVGSGNGAGEGCGVPRLFDSQMLRVLLLMLRLMHACGAGKCTSY
jgi:hypothetical protein